MAERIEAGARVYAQALYEAAVEAGAVREGDADLDALTQLLAGDTRLLRALLNPRLPREAKHRIAAKGLAAAHPLVRNTVSVMIDHGRLNLLHDVHVAFAEMAAIAGGVLHLEVTSAVPLDPAQISDLESRVSAATGLETHLDSSVDSTIIGGLVLGARGVLLDASVRRELEDIRRALITTPLPVGSEA